MLNGVGNGKNKSKGLISKEKDNFSLAAHFFCTFP